MVTSDLSTPGCEHFFFGLDGTAELQCADRRFALEQGGFGYIPVSTAFQLHGGAGGPAQVLWIKRRYEGWPGLGPPGLYGGHRRDVPATQSAVLGLLRNELISAEDPAFDFNMTLMSFDASVSLPQIEIHDEEHGLYMISGAGAYHLDGQHHEVHAGDFVYMAPFCPQGFRADTRGAEYLLYKDVYRDGF
ncbi:MAG: cupin domain-containing protein [Actinomycetota bacterium]|nr:cupin domain-containing protein [Actinomycetota bacterium]